MTDSNKLEVAVTRETPDTSGVISKPDNKVSLWGQRKVNTGLFGMVNINCTVDENRLIAEKLMNCPEREAWLHQSLQAREEGYFKDAANRSAFIEAERAMILKISAVLDEVIGNTTEY